MPSGNAPIKRVVVVTAHIAELKPSEKPGYAYAVQETCKGSAAYGASAQCQGTMALWVTSADALDTNLKAQTTARNKVMLLEEEERSLVVDYDNATIAFGASVQTTAKDDATIALAMGMQIRSDASPPAHDAASPLGAHVGAIKKTGAPTFAWDAVPGAVLYVAQLSVSPATETSWVTLFGRGRSRRLPPLVPGQTYLLRVAAQAKDGKPSAWSDVVTIIGK